MNREQIQRDIKKLDFSPYMTWDESLEKIADYILDNFIPKETNNKYEEFFDWCIQYSYEGMDVDGGSMQDKAESLGLIVLCTIPEDMLEEYPQCAECETNEIYFSANSDEAKKWAIKLKQSKEG